MKKGQHTPLAFLQNVKFLLATLGLDFVSFSVSLLHLASHLINLYILFYISKHQNSIVEIFHIFLILVFFNLCVEYVLRCLSNYILAKNEIRLRSKLAEIDGLPPSRANNDVFLAVNAIYFFFVGPGLLFSILVYLCFLAYQDFDIFAFVVGAIVVIAFPSYRYFHWRRKKISKVREARNRILDNYACEPSHRLQLNESYFQHLMNFWLHDSIYGSFYLLFFGSIIFLYYLSSEVNQAITIFMALLFIFRQVSFLFNAFSVYQENHRSLKAIEHELKENQIYV